MKELINRLKQEYPVQKDYWEDDLYTILKDIKAVKVAEGLDVDKHRWYETSIIVFQLPNNKFLGVRACTDLFSECSSFDDIYWTYDFFEMEQVNIPSYVIKETEE